MPLINVRGVDHYYEWISRSNDSDQKPVMVFIHGWGGSARYWQGTADALSDRFNCLLYDLRGFGRSEVLSGSSNLGYELEEYAEDLAILLDALKLDRVYIHSHSMGASIATFFINRYSDRVKQAILTCNGIFEYDEKAFAAFHKFSKYVVQFRYNWFLQVPFADRMFMARFLHKQIGKRDRMAFLEDYLMASYDAALGTIPSCVSKKATEVMPQEFANIRVPTLMISGEKDLIIPASMGRQAADLNEKIKYVEIAKTAHFPMLEDRESYLQAVGKFLKVESLV